METIIFQVESRDSASQEIVADLQRRNIPFTQEIKSSVSSFPIIEATLNNKLYRLVFKPLKTINTKLAESAQCVYCAAAQYARNDIDDAFVHQNIERFKAMFDVDETIANVLETLSPTWKTSSILIANHVRKKLRHGDYVFHRNSNITKAIYAKFGELNKAEGRPFAQSDKWNPADIWAVRRSVRVDVSKCTSLNGLNQYLRDAIDKGDVVPISLKQVTKIAKISTINTNEAHSKPKTKGEAASLKGLFSNTGKSTWMSSKNCKITFTSGTKDMQLVLRSPYPRAPVNGELQQRGSSAQHGKVNGKVIHRVIHSCGANYRIPDQGQINTWSYNKDPKLIKAVFDLAQKHDKGSKVTLAEFSTFIRQEKDYDWLASKYGALIHLDAFASLNPIKRSQAINMIYSHGSSAHELSGPFLKVS